LKNASGRASETASAIPPPELNVMSKRLGFGMRNVGQAWEIIFSMSYVKLSKLSETMRIDFPFTS
jgi:hypothetical protein